MTDKRLLNFGTPDSVGFLLQATIGGSAEQFLVSQLGDRFFKFLVASRTVGLFVANLRSFSSVTHKVFFHLWGYGGPNWKFEYSLYLKEEEAAWQPAPASSKFIGKSSADVVKSVPLSGANSIPLGNHRQAAYTSSKFNGKSFADVVKSVPLSGANSVPLGNPHQAAAGVPLHQPSSRRSVFDRLQFPHRPAPDRRSVFDRVVFPSHSRSSRVVNSPSAPCGRCLLPGHHRVNCRWPIRCSACRKTSHTAALS